MKQDAKNGNGRIVPNIGQTGAESIRLGGMTLETLPMAEAAQVKEQWYAAKESNERQEVENILAKYPKAKIPYLESRIVECEENIGRIQKLINDQNQMIREYTAQIGLCKHRDKEVAKLNPDDAGDAAKIKALKIQFPPYNVDAMTVQIGLCEDAIERSNEIIKAEYDSIAELKDTISRCHQRDASLAPYGVKVE